MASGGRRSFRRSRPVEGMKVLQKFLEVLAEQNAEEEVQKY
jgi:hypothetical protein